MRKIRSGDEVVLKTGKDAGKRGRVSRMLGDRATVDSLNVCKKAVKPVPQRGQSGGFQEKLLPIHLSNLQLWDEKSKKPGRVRVQKEGGAGRVRVFKKTGDPVPVVAVKDSVR